MSPTKASTKAIESVNGQVLKPTVRIERITPARADSILAENNLRNRDLRESRVTHLVGNIERDEWRLTGAAIVFDVDGVLLDGQHRLAACVIAEKPIEVIVLRNAPRESQDVMDDTLRRNLGDALRLRGEHDVFRLGAGIAWYARIVYAEISGTPHYANNARRPSIPQLLQFYADNPGLSEASVESRPATRALKLRPGPALAVYYRLMLVDAKDTAIFFDKLRTGADLPEGSPLLALRRYSQEEINRGRGRARNPDFKWVAVVVKAWNAWREGRDVKVLSYVYSGTTRETWPEPY
jgi:hypothetical protein